MARGGFFAKAALPNEAENSAQGLIEQALATTQQEERAGEKFGQ